MCNVCFFFFFLHLQCLWTKTLRPFLTVFRLWCECLFGFVPFDIVIKENRLGINHHQFAKWLCTQFTQSPALMANHSVWFSYRTGNSAARRFNGCRMRNLNVAASESATYPLWKWVCCWAVDGFWHCHQMITMFTVNHISKYGHGILPRT